MKGHNRSHTDLSWVRLYLKDGSYPQGLSISEKRIVRKRAETFCYKDEGDGELYFLGTQKLQQVKPNPRKVILTNEDKWNVIKEVHIDEHGSHIGLEKCMELLDIKYYWVGMSSSIRDFIRQCQICKVKHPKMIQPSGALVYNDADDISSNATSDVVRKDDLDQDDISTVTDEDNSVCEVSNRAIKEVPTMPPVRQFWEKVDMRLYGPYALGRSQKCVMSAIDMYSLWPEVFYMENLSPANVAHNLLKLACRYGQMKEIVMTKHNVILEMGLVSALDILKLEGGLEIKLSKTFTETQSDVAHVQLNDVVTKFVESNPMNWYQCLEFCLLPVRVSCPDRAEYSPSYLAHGRELPLPNSLLSKPDTLMECRLNQSEMNDTVQKLMAIHLHYLYSADFSKPLAKKPFKAPSSLDEAFTGDFIPVEDRHPPSVSVAFEITSGKRGMTTRSKTGHSRTKLLDPNTYEVTSPGTKRRATQTPIFVEEDSPASKKIKVEIISDDASSDVDVGENDTSGTEKKGKPSLGMIDLDYYYECIRLYVTLSAYPPKSTRGFKRVMRGASKNYTFENGELYHKTDIRKQKRRIIMKREDRLAVMLAGHILENGTHLSKSKVLEKLNDVHWRGLTLDCEALIMACPDCSNGEAYPRKTGSRTRNSDVDKNGLEDLQKDRQSVYRNLEIYLKTGQFQDTLITEEEVELEEETSKFMIRDGQLRHIIGQKRQAVVTKMKERLEIINDTITEKGKQADVNNVVKAILAHSFWYGMKIDVIQAITLGDEKGKKEAKLSPERTLQKHNVKEKYFIFREYFMQDKEQKATVLDKEVDLSNLTNEEQSMIPDEETPSNNETEPATESTPSTTTTTVTVSSDTGQSISEPQVTSPQTISSQTVEEQEEERPTGIFVATASSSNEEVVLTSPSRGEQSTAEASMDTYDTQVELVNTEEVQSVASSVSQPEASSTSSTTASAVSTGPQVATQQDKVLGPKPGKTKTVVVRLNSKGQAVVVQYPDSGGKPSDAITEAAVKSILPSSTSTPMKAGKFDDTMDKSFSDGPSDEEEVIEEEVEEVEEEILDEMDGEEYEEEEEEEEEKEVGSKLSISGLTSDGSMYDAEVLKYTSIDSDSDTEKKGRTPTPRPAFKCNICSKVMYGPIKFKMHMYRHTGQKPFACDQCHKTYTNNKSLTFHKRTHSGELPFLCSLCGKRMPSKISLKSHLKTHAKGGGMPAQCDICLRTFARRHLMERHKHFKHTTAQTHFKCTECPKVFGHQRSLKRHFLSHHMGVKNHMCDLCGKGFYRKEYLTSHLAHHSAGTGDRALKKQRASESTHQGQSHHHDEDEEEEEETDDSVQRIVLQQDASGNLRVVNVAMAREVKRLLATRRNIGDTMVVIDETGDTSQGTLVHLEPHSSNEPTLIEIGPNGEQTQVQENVQEEVLHVPIESQNFIVSSQDLEDTHSSTANVVTEEQSAEDVSTSSTAQNVLSFTYTSTATGAEAQGNQELIYGQPAVQYEVECVGDVGDEEALSAINLLAQASAAQYENVVVTSS